MSFIHLHNHSHYSLLDGLSKIDTMVKKAKEYGMPALALTDHGAMYGSIEFYKECKKQDIKPIIGVEAYMATRSRFNKETGIDSKRYHITLLAKNLTGYKNLVKLTTAAHLEGYYYKPRIDKDILAESAEGIICLSGCPAGELARSLALTDMDKARSIVEEHLEIFGRENYFLEIMKHEEVPDHEKVVTGVMELSKEYDIPIVGTWDAHYTHKDDNEAQDTLVAINTGNEVGKGGMSMKAGDYSFISPEEAERVFKDIPGATSNTLKVSEMCDIELEIGKFVFPTFPLPEGETDDQVLEKIAFQGLAKKGLDKNPDAVERLKYELGIIAMKGYASYFLVVEDLIRFSRESGIYYNIRGSVAGSMTTYSLDITKIDPLDYKIPFERFLNPERPSAPDIDMDFADNRRDEIIEYAKQKYGADKVAQIGTFGTMMARGAVRDVARALGKPYDFGDRIAKLIPMGSQGFPMTIDRAIEITPELKEIYDNEPGAKRVIDLAKKIEGSARHISVHAAGVVIAPKPLLEYVPVQYDPKGESIITQYDMYSVGEDGIGLTKFDFLGLRNLSILANAVYLVKKIYEQEINLDEIPMDDQKTFAMLAKGETEGLFQLNGSGMTRWLKELKPSTIHDINAMVALYRPGPMQFIPDYIQRKHNPSMITYADPVLEPILRQTYGVLVYQDDLLIMAHDLAGYSWGEVDKFRKAVGKKIPEEMAKQKEKFISGCVEHSKWPRKKAEEIWAWIEPFAAYGFNKAHSASYGRVAYQTSYMKANFPVAYMCACLTAESGDVEKIAVFLNECKRMNISVLPPDVNESFVDFGVIKGATIDEDRIRFGLLTIKNLGIEIAKAIVEERKTNGKFTSFTNFLERVNHKNLNKKALEALTKAGALDSLGEERGAILANMDEALTYHKQHMDNGNQDSLFGGMTDTSSMPVFKLKEAPPIDEKLKLAWEKELLGLYLSGHPLEKFREKFEQAKHSIKDLAKMKNDTPVVLGGIIEDVREILTKRGDRMAFVKISDFHGMTEAVCFASIFQNKKDILVVDNCVAVKGRVSFRNGEPSIVIEDLKLLE